METGKLKKFAQAARRSLREQVAMGTLTIQCSAPRPDGEGGGAGFATAFWAGWDGFVALLVGLVRLWPLLFLFVPVIVWRLLRRGRRSDARA